MKNPKTAIILTTLYLVVYTLSGQLYPNLSLMLFMFSLSPVLLIWMVYTVLKYGVYSGKELKDNEEWGYEDYFK